VIVASPSPDPKPDRRAEIAAEATGPGRTPKDIAYTASEHATWSAVMAALVPLWECHAASVALTGLDRLALDRSRIPQLCDITRRLTRWSGFRFDAVAGLVPKEEFFAGLAEGRFLSTQYVRDGSSPLYTPEPDVIHEVIGHAHLLATAEAAELHRLAGRAMVRLTEPASRQFVADVFWFSGEFGVVREAGAWKAYGAGLLSSFGELGVFARHARIEPLDIGAMGTLPYDISQYQPRLFGADSIQEVLDVVGGFFAGCTDTSIARLRRSQHEVQA
jgi:phenylalanine-4-hydroxylase